MVIGISGKIGSGKDTVGIIIQYLCWNKNGTESFEEFNQIYTNIDKFTYQNIAAKQLSGWEIKKFADKLKNIVCLLIGCTREQLEDREFKESELGEEWWYYKGETKLIPYLEATEQQISRHERGLLPLIKLTPRKLLQLLGTEAGREIIHPNIWVNALFSSYKPIDYRSVPNNDSLYGESYTDVIYPNWIITDMRFENELKAVKDRNGITIRVNRPFRPYDKKQPLLEGIQRTSEHPSETALDNAEFDYVIDNNGTMEELIEKVKEILIKERIIC